MKYVKESASLREARLAEEAAYWRDRAKNGQYYLADRVKHLMAPLLAPWVKPEEAAA